MGLIDQVNEPFNMGLADLLDEDDAYIDPVDWVGRKAKLELWSGQQNIIRSVEQYKKTAVVSAHGVGKSLTAAATGCWWIDSHPIGEAFVVSTAPTSAQVHAILWEEIRKIHGVGRLRGEVNLSDNWMINRTLVGMGRKPQDYNQHAFQGIHRKYVLVIVDEACGVPEQLWNAIDSITTGDSCRILAIGNPDDPSSHFAKVAGPGSTWNKIYISVFDSPLFTGESVSEELQDLLTGPEWVEDKRLSWGEESPLWTSKVLGRFPDTDEYSVIPLSWVNAAVNRWKERKGSLGRPEGYQGHRIVGVDVARFGTDKTVLATRYGDLVSSIEEFSQLDTEATTDRVRFRMKHPRDIAVVDVVGVGGGVVDKLVREKKRVEPFSAQGRTDLTDITGEMKFNNSRSAAWWNLRELLDPSRGATLALPDNDKLIADLISPKWKVAAGGRLVVESKDDIRKRVGRSTDFGDAVIQAMWIPEAGPPPNIPASYSWTGINDRTESESDLDMDGAIEWGQSNAFDPSVW